VDWSNGRGVDDGELTYFVDTNGQSQSDCSPFYHRDIEDILGQQDDLSYITNPDTSTDPRRCFNCGSPSHTLSDCPSPRNHPLISLSRQLFTFHQQLQQSAHRQALGDIERIHVVEGRKQERLDFLDWFEPGEVRSCLLREALGLDEDEGGNVDGDGEWLRNMAIWGYPKGWIGERDPRYKVMRRIEGEVDDDDDGDDEDPFVIFGDANEQEEIKFTPSPQQKTYTKAKHMPESPNEDPPLTPKIHRWASYPTTYFSSALLPVYTGYALPPLPTDSPQIFAPNRQAFKDNINIVSGNDPPPPPSITPPPLPPPLLLTSGIVALDEELDGEAEMELSDSD